MCPYHGIVKKLSVLRVLIGVPVANDLVEVMVWGDDIYLGEKKGKQHTHPVLHTRLDTNQGMLEVTDPRTNEERMVHRRIWLIINKKGQHVLCLASDHYRYFRNENPGYKARYIVFTDALTTVGQFMSNPHKQSCKYFGGSVLRDSYSITLIVPSVMVDSPSMPLCKCFAKLVRIR